MISLRDYQERDLEHIRETMLAGARRVLYVAPTGSGKGVLFGWLARSVVAKGRRCLILVHRRELLRQTIDKLALLGADGVAVETVQAAAKHGAPDCDLLVIDEGHHLHGSGSWSLVLDGFKGHVLGVTATPERLDGKGLRGSFDEMVLGPTVRDLIDAGWLADHRTFASPAQSRAGLRRVGGDFARGAAAAWVSGQRRIVGDVAAGWRDRVRGPAVAFCATIAHAEDVTAELAATGIRSASIDGRMNDDQRACLLGRLAGGDLDVLTSCDLISEGFDCPELVGVIMLRPTASLAMYLQMCGRALRPKADGSRAIIMDHVGNCAEHGLPDERRLWSLDGRKARESAEKEAKTGGGKRKAPLTIEGQLKQVDPVILARWRSDKHGAMRGARTLRELSLICAALGWKPGAAWWEARRRGWV